MISCTRFSCRLAAEACVRRQEDARNYNPPTQCADCQQGREVARELGVKVVDKKSLLRKSADRAREAVARAKKGRKFERYASVWSSHYQGLRVSERTPTLSSIKKMDHWKVDVNR